VIDWSQEQLLSLLLRAFVCGVAMGMYYDVLRIVKLLFSSESAAGRAAKMFRATVTFFTDLIFWLTFGIVSIMLIYRISGGVFRGLVYLGMLMGAAIYHLTVGKLTLKIISFAVSFFKKVIRAIIKVIIFPFVMIFRGVFSLYRLTIGKIIGKIINRVKEARLARKLKKAPLVTEQEECGKEDDGRVKGKEAYRRDNRISFGYEKQ
jgi:hypothetical protein